MMKRTVFIILSFCLCIALGLGACGEEEGRLVTPVGQDTQDDGGDSEGGAQAVVPGNSYSEDQTLPKVPEYAEARGEGYAFDYDPELLTPGENPDSWEYTGETALSVYISIQRLEDMTPEDTAAGLALQSGVDGTEPEDVFFGAEGVEAKTVHVEQEQDNCVRTQDFYALPYGQGTLLVEVGASTDLPEQAQGAIETALGSFAVME